MKKIKLLIILGFGLSLLSSCGDWLNVTPKTQVTREDLFKSQNGFRDALTGVYIQMNDSTAYGKDLTLGLTEYLVNHWDVVSKSAEQYLTFHNYSEEASEARIKRVYAQLYKIISSCNAILDKVDEANDNGVFTLKGYYEMVKGEALGIRAYCHLDLIRLFGPVPLEENKGVVTLPYILHLDRGIDMPVSFQQYCSMMLEDIKNANTLLKAEDPIMDTKVPATVVTEDFFTARYYRMNYYAVKALEARANLYVGNRNEAYEAAKEIIEAKKDDGTTIFRLGTLADLTSQDNTLSKEHMFGLYKYNLEDIRLNDLIKYVRFKKGSSLDGRLNTIFSDEKATDIRAQLWTVVQSQAGVNLATNKKFFVRVLTGQESENIKDVMDKRVSMLRLAEMYLIAVECAPLGEAQAYWEKFRLSRNIPITALTEASLRSTIIKEYYKEFYAEGQQFYMHKRLNSPKGEIPEASTAAASTLNYVLPLPKTEIIKY